MSERASREELKRERADLAAELAKFDADKAAGLANPRGYRAEFFRQQIAELDAAIGDAEMRET